MGWLRVDKLAELNEKVDEIVQEITPPGEMTPPRVILKALSKLLPFADVNSIPELGGHVTS